MLRFAVFSVANMRVKVSQCGAVTWNFLQLRALKLFRATNRFVATEN